MRQTAIRGPLFVANHQRYTIVPNYGADYWLNIKENNRILKDIIDYLRMHDGFSVNIQMDKNKIVHLFLEKRGTRRHIVFPEKFPYVSPIIETAIDIESCIGDPSTEVPVWDYTGDIYNSFINFYKKF